MNKRLNHNGCDVLMLGFDYELRQRGFAGNSCQIVLELSTAIQPADLEKRVAELVTQFPILTSRPGRGWNLKPCWKPTRAVPQVRVHAESPDLAHQLFNDPLAVHRGELIRFDLSGNKLFFTWTHALMDAKSAEYFLALVGDTKTPVPENGEDWFRQRALPVGGFRARGQQAWRELRRLDEFQKALPVSLSTQRAPVTPTMKHQVITFSVEDSARIRANASRLCGFFGDTNFHFAVMALELHQLHERTSRPSASYVLPIPVGLRPKGTRAPLFSNQITMMLHQFLPEQLADLEKTIAAVKAKNKEFLRDEHINPGIALAQMFRGLPLPFYMRMIKHELRGEICSLFFGDTANVDPAVKTFFGATIEKFIHIPAITVPPGMGIVFSR
ncbi:MAG: hypothetical protein ABIN25_04200, partial [Ginsengibacter sp.]